MRPSVMQATVVTQAAALPNQESMQVAFFNAAGAPLFMVTTVPTAANLLLTGYAAGAAGALSATDSVNIAFRKLAARVDAIETAATALAARVTVLENA